MRRDGLRINLIGTSGAGKTTLGRRVAERLGVPHIELDELHWGPNWTSRPDADFHGDLREFTAGESWVLCGNYTNARPIFADRVTCFVWLDYSRWRVTWRVTWRVFCRSVKRLCTREELWAGNRESFRLTFCSRDSVIWWSLKTFGKNRRRHRAFFRELKDQPGVETIRLRSTREAECWLAEIAGAGCQAHGH